MTRRAETLALLRDYESRNITFVDPDGSWPIVWERARGVFVWDTEGRQYLDLTAAFGVAAAGHANPEVVRAGRRQMGRLLHAMGDVHPHALKARLARELSRLTFERWGANPQLADGSEYGDPLPLTPSEREKHRPPAGKTRRPGKSESRPGALSSPKGKTIFCNSGFEAVEAALKTAMLATGKPGIIAFEGAYHGLGYGALNATHREHFRSPFNSQLGRFGQFVPFPVAGARFDLGRIEARIRRLLRGGKIGAVLAEPVQARGGVNVPPPEFLPMLRRLCSERGALLILDEIYTGFGRTGKWFACEHWGVAPDLVCLGKALTGGFPLSACVGRADLMDAAWPPSTGEAIHTSTFLGHPVGCAMALAQLREIESRELVSRGAGLGADLLARLSSLAAAAPRARFTARGLGLLAGLEIRASNGAPATEAALGVVKTMLQRGFILLPEGGHAHVISFTPPLTITKRQLRETVEALATALGAAEIR